MKKNILWDFLGKIFQRGVGFIVSIFLARLLMPEDFALIAMVMAFVSIAFVFVDAGLGSALIQSKDVDERHFSSVFWLNMMLATFLGIVCFFSAPLVADFYENEELLKLTQVLSLSFLFSTIGGVNRCILIKEMKFKTLTKVNFISAVVSGVVGVGCAYLGFGVWSLVAQQFTYNIVGEVLLWLETRWLPLFIFDWKLVKPLWQYSIKLFLSSLIEITSQKIDVFVIGRLFSESQLGYYGRGKSLNDMIAVFSSSSFGAVLFPVLSKIQDDLVEVRKVLKDFLHLSSYGAFFLCGFLYFSAEDIIVILFSEKWLPTVPIFKIMVLGGFGRPINAILLTPLKSLGESGVFLKLEIIKKVILAITYLVGFNWGIEGFLYAMVVSVIISTLFNMYYVGQVVEYKVLSQVKLVLQYFIIATLSSLVVYLISDYFKELVLDRILHLLLISIIFTLTYVIINTLFKTKGHQRLVEVSQPVILKISNKINNR